MIVPEKPIDNIDTEIRPEQLDLFPPAPPTDVDVLAAAIAELQSENRVLRAQLKTVHAGIVRPDEIRDMIREIVEQCFEERRPRRVLENGVVRVLRIAS